MKSKKWQTHRKRNRANNCLNQKPWESATGPKTDMGKSTASDNARKHGAYDADILALSNALYLQSQFVYKMMIDNQIKDTNQ